MSAKKPPKYALQKATNQARVRINGKDIYLGFYGSSDSHLRYANALARWQSTAEESPEKLTIGQLTIVYYEFAKGHYRKNQISVLPVRELKPIIEWWWRRARPITKTKDWSETWAAFARCWERARPASDGATLGQMVEQTRNDGCPPECYEEFLGEICGLVAAVCRRLAIEAVDGQFFWRLPHWAGSWDSRKAKLTAAFEH